MQILYGLTKKSIADRLAEELAFTNRTAYRAVQLMLDTITEALVKGSTVELRDFGVFDIRERRMRIGRDPHKPEEDIPIPERLIVRFRAGKALRERVRALKA